MSTQNFNLPDVGEGLTEAEIVTWKVAPGDDVAINDVICEIETAKSLVELPSPYAGVVGDLLVGEGTTVEVGTPIISFVSDAAPAAAPQPAAPAEEAGGSVLVGYGTGAGATSRRTRPAVRPVRSSVGVIAKPPIRKLARDLNVDLSSVSPTGADGEVTRDDVVKQASQASVFRNIETPEWGAVREETVAPKSAPVGLARGVAASAAHDSDARTESIPVKGVRKVSASAMVQSAYTAPHVTVWKEVDATRTMELVKRLKTSPDYAQRVEMACPSERHTAMSTQNFNLPDVGEGLTEAEIVTWKVAPGDDVAINDVICEIETAKSLVELPSPYSGVVGDLLVGEGTTVEVGTPIISFVSDAAPAAVPQPAAPAEEAGGSVLVGYGTGAGATSRRTRAAVRPVRSSVGVIAKPPIRKLARDLNVDLSSVSPTGADGEVTRDDVVKQASQASVFRNIETPEWGAVREETVAPKSAPVGLARGVAASAAHDSDARTESIPVKGVRKVSASAMVQSAYTAPHVTVWKEVDATRTMELVKRLKTSADYVGDRSELRVVLDLHDGSPVAQCVGEAGVRPLPETVGMRWRDAVAVHGGGDAGAEREHTVAEDARLLERCTQPLEDRAPALVGRLVRGDLHPMMHERAVERIRDGHGEVRVAGVDPDDDAEIGGEGEAPCGATGAVAPGGAGVGEFMQHVGADQGFDRIDRGGTRERGAGHDVAGGELAGVPGEVEHGADARASGSETSRDFCHTP